MGTFGTLVGSTNYVYSIRGIKRPGLTYHQRTRYESRWWFCPSPRRGRSSQASRGADRARVTTSASIRYIIDAAEAFKLSWKYRPAVRVINVPPPYKVLNFRSVRRRNISRNTAIAAKRNAAVYQPDENYSADEDVNIGEPKSLYGRARTCGVYCFDKRAPWRTLRGGLYAKLVDGSRQWEHTGR